MSGVLVCPQGVWLLNCQSTLNLWTALRQVSLNLLRIAHVDIIVLCLGINDDYVPLGTSVVFEAGLTGDGCIQCLDITIMNDTIYEGDDQRFSVVGSNVGLGCVFSENDTATVYIMENPEDGTLLIIQAHS